MNAAILRDFLIGLFFIFLEVVIFQHLSFFGASPDPLLIYLLWLALKYDRINIVLFAAALGLVQDALFDFWGLHMFTKTLLLFFTYNFLRRRSESRLLLWQVMIVVFIASFIHNGIFLSLSSFIDAYASGFMPIIFLIGNSLYTAALSGLFFIFKGNQ
ncbi:MAG: rod shape-determining protein MreD [Balneolaceae bacterium]